MSLTSKITVGAAAVITTGIIGYVHYSQNEDRRRLHEGVLRDVERQENYRRSNPAYMNQGEFGNLINKTDDDIEDMNPETVSNDQSGPTEAHRLLQDSKVPLTPAEKTKSS